MSLFSTSQKNSFPRSPQNQLIQETSSELLIFRLTVIVTLAGSSSDKEFNVCFLQLYREYSHQTCNNQYDLHLATIYISNPHFLKKRMCYVIYIVKISVDQIPFSLNYIIFQIISIIILNAPPTNLWLTIKIVPDLTDFNDDS